MRKTLLIIGGGSILAGLMTSWPLVVVGVISLALSGAWLTACVVALIFDLLWLVVVPGTALTLPVLAIGAGTISVMRHVLMQRLRTRTNDFL